MKKTYYLTILVSIITLFGSCAVSEDVYFASDGKIRYEMLVDGSGLLSTMPDIGNKLNNSEMPSDTTITFRDAMQGKYPDYENLPQEEKHLLEKLEPFSLELKNNPEESELSFLLKGDFADAQSMAEAFLALDSLAHLANDSHGGMPVSSLNKFKTTSRYTWDGKSMSRSPISSTENKDNEDEDSEADTDDNDAMMTMLMANGDYTARYHFPQKIKSINNKDAMFSQDGKTVIVKVPLAKFNTNPNVLDINIELED